MAQTYYVVDGKVTTNYQQARDVSRAIGKPFTSGNKTQLKQDGMDVDVLPALEELRQ